MAIGVNSVLSMGVGALFASQANIQTTANNVSNVNTPGYSRQAVVLQERYAINYYPGQVGQGVQATEIIRYFDTFIESNYVNKLSTASRWQAQYSQLRYVDNIFNEANTDGIANSISEFFNSWNKLAQTADSHSSREALLAQAETMTIGIRNTDEALRELEDQINTMVRQDVATANQLLEEIAALNKEISANYLEGRNNPNQLMDARDAKVRELATIIDVDIQDRGPGAYVLTMKNGNMLVQDNIAFKLEFRGAGVENHLTANSPYKVTTPGDPAKTVHFSGTDSYEYTLEIVDDGTIGGGATFKVSRDGGNSWLTNDDGTLKLFNANEDDLSVHVGDLEIWFDAGDVATGDRFVISPKSDVYWISPTAGPLNVSPQIYGDGRDNTLRITGGSLGGLLEFRDYKLGEFRDRLDALAKSMIWEVNRIHSQGSGLTPISSMLGTYTVGNTGVPLGSPEARFTWSENLQAGNMNFAVYDADGQALIPYPGLNVLSQLPGGNFDPALHSLQDVANAISGASFTDAAGVTHNNVFSAEIIHGQLKITSNPPGEYSFSMTDDTTGLAAALGLNTFLTGDSAATIGVHPELATNLNLVNSGRVNITGEINPGDNQTAMEIAALISKAVDISTTWNKGTSQTLAEYYATLVTKVGADTSSVRYTAATETAMAQDLYDRQEEISGVNLDEEMSNLIKFQASYKAAAKLITTADEMLQTLLSLKQ